MGHPLETWIIIVLTYTLYNIAWQYCNFWKVLIKKKTFFNGIFQNGYPPLPHPTHHVMKKWIFLLVNMLLLNLFKYLYLVSNLHISGQIRSFRTSFNLFWGKKFRFDLFGNHWLVLLRLVEGSRKFRQNRRFSAR